MAMFKCHILSYLEYRPPAILHAFPLVDFDVAEVPPRVPPAVALQQKWHRAYSNVVGSPDVALQLPLLRNYKQNPLSNVKLVP